MGEARIPDAGDPAAEWVPLNDLRPWIGNPRKNSDAVKAVADSIRKFGFGAPIVARKADRQIIGGHTRLQAARRLGLTHVPVRYLDLSPEDAQLLALADNKLGEIAEWDEGMLGRILAELKASNADLAASGFDSAEIDRLLADLNAERIADVEEDPVPEPPETAGSVPGTVYDLGPHRLLCRDSTRANDVQKVVAGDRVSLLWTDAPYNVAYASDLYSLYRNSLIHSWHLFAASMTADERAPSRLGGTLQLGLLDLLQALRTAIDDFLDRLATCAELQANVIARYRQLRDTAAP